MINPKFEQVLVSLEEAMWEFEALHPGELYGLGLEAFRAALKLFMSISAEQLYHHLTKQSLSMDEICSAASAYGEALRNVLLMHVGIDSQDLYANVRPSREVN